MKLSLDRRQLLTGTAGIALGTIAMPYIARGATTKITYWAWSEHIRGAKAVYPRFRELHPDIEVDIVNLNPQEIQDKVLVAMATGTGAPDVALIIERNFPTYPPTGGLLDVSKYLAGKEATVTSRLWQRLFLDGKAYGVPYTTSAALMFYRRDIFERAGIKAPIETWPEWIEAGKRVRALGDVYMHQVSAGAAGNGPLGAYFESAGAQFFNEAGKVVKNNAKAAEQLRFYYDLVGKADIALLVRHNSPEHFVAVKTGRLAALHSAPWGLDRLEQEAPDDAGKWGVMAWPRWSADAPAWTGTWGGSVLAIPASGKNHDAAAIWATHLGMDPQAQITIWKNSYNIPTSLPALQDPAFKEPHPYLKQSIYEAAIAPRETQFFNLVPEWARINIAMGRELDLIFAKKKTAEQAWGDFESEMTGIYG